MNTYKNRLFVSDGDLWRCDVLRRDIDPKHAKRDELSMGYWIEPNTKTATWLLLKGCQLVNRDPDSWIGMSKVLGSNILGPKCSGQ